MKYITLLVLTILSFTTTTVIGQNKDSLAIQNRLHTLEEHDKFFNKEVEIAVDSINNRNNWLAFLASLGSFALFGAGFLFSRSYFKNKVDEMIAEKLKEKEALLKKMITDADIEQTLFNKKKIKIVGEENPDVLKKVLRTIGYNMRNLCEEEATDYDLLFINNTEGIFFSGVGRNDPMEAKKAKSSVLINLINNMNPNASVLYYSSKGVHFPSDINDFKEDLHKINFVTNPAQIYGNLLNSLKYQDKIASA